MFTKLWLCFFLLLSKWTFLQYSCYWSGASSVPKYDLLWAESNGQDQLDKYLLVIVCFFVSESKLHSHNFFYIFINYWILLKLFNVYGGTIKIKLCLSAVWYRWVMQKNWSSVPDPHWMFIPRFLISNALTSAVVTMPSCYSYILYFYWATIEPSMLNITM